MAENRRGKDKRFYYTRGQLVLLGGAFTLASVIIFFLGIFVGKGIEARKIVKPEEPLVKIPVAPSTQGSSGASGTQPREELTFYDTLTKSPDTEPATEEARREAKEPERRAKAEVKEKKLQTKEQTAAKIAEEKSEKIVPPAAPPEATERGENGKNWTVQVNAFPDPKSAKIWVDRLKNKGYNAYSTEVLNQGKTWYRVRVGRYASQQEAEKIEETLRVKENITKAFVTNR